MAVKFELNRAGVRKLLQSSGARKVCEDAAKQALQTLGDGYGSDARTGKNRVIVEVSPQTPKAHYENKRHNTVLKAVRSVKL
jgi:hypothetical protein